MRSRTALHNGDEYVFFGSLQRSRSRAANLSSIGYTVWLQSRFERGNSRLHKLKYHESHVSLVDDELRCALTDQSSIHYWLFSEDEQSEFLFRLFKLIVLGGPVCQYENDINVYLGKGLKINASISTHLT